MEKKLTALFDFQRYEENADLARVIDATHSRYATRKLSMDEMDMIAAAGTPDLPPTLRTEKEKR